jgi:hypothetical protein
MIIGEILKIVCFWENKFAVFVSGRAGQYTNRYVNKLFRAAKYIFIQYFNQYNRICWFYFGKKYAFIREK